MDKSIIQPLSNKSNSLLSNIWLFGIVVSSLIAIANLILFFISGYFQYLVISGACAVAIGFFFLSKQLLHRDLVFGSCLIAAFTWIVMILGHYLFWSGVNGYLIISLWIFPLLIFLSLRVIKERLTILLIPLLFSLLLFFGRNIILFPRLPVGEFSNSRFITPIYFFIFGVLLFFIFLRSIQTRSLSTRLIISMALIVFIPIVVLTMVSYSSTKSNDTLTATDTLNQISTNKSNEIFQWTSGLSNALDSTLSEIDTNQIITGLLEASIAEDNSALDTYRDALEYILTNISTRYEFKEIYVLDPSGIVVTSTKESYIGTDFSEYEFFIKGRAELSVIPPFYYPLEDQTSIFITNPVFSLSGNFLGVIIARASIDELLSIVDQPSTEAYQTTSAFIINSDGTLLQTPRGRSALVVNTEGAQAALFSKSTGSLNYDNIDGQPVIGVFQWLPDLNIALITEVNESEVFQRLPNLIIGNLAIGFLGFFLAILASFSIVRSITAPINSLVDASKEVISGNFNFQLPVNREDELGLLTEAFNKMTSEIKVLVADLEIRVADRTRDLETRSQDLETSALIARDASLASDINELLDRTSQLIQERFGFYYVGIYLNDQKNEYTVLSSAAGEVGSRLVELHHKLKIGETGIVGSVTKLGEPRIASDVGADAVYFQNPLLPNTRSEMALPLIVRQQIVGALDVQSEKVSAFDQNDIRIMSVLADQLAIAIERTRLVEETIKNAAEMKLALQTQTSSAWKEYLTRADQPLGYRYEGVSVKPISSTPPVSTQDNTSTSSVEITGQAKPGKVVSIPIKLRGSTIGTLDFQFSTSNVPIETLQYLEVAADRLSLALENARLFNEVTLRAEREKSVANITTNIRSKIDPQQMVQTALEELKKVLGTNDIKIREINPPMSDNK